MHISYTDKKIFSPEQISDLFISVNWNLSAKNPQRLHKALLNSPTVFTAWHENNLVGLARAIDDNEMTAYIHYVLVHPKYQGFGIARHLVNLIKNKYSNYLYIELMPDESKNAIFYQKLGFKIVSDGVPMQLCHAEKYILNK